MVCRVFTWNLVEEKIEEKEMITIPTTTMSQMPKLNIQNRSEN